MSILNPFAELFETERYVHARTLRTTFAQKMRDTFFSFFGSFNILDRGNKKASGHYHIGILDVFTLGIPYFLTLVATELLREVRSTPLKVLFGFIAGILVLPRAICAGILTLISLPFIGIAQAISSSKASDLKNKINTYTVSAKDSAGNEIKTNLGALLINKEMSIETVGQVEQVIIAPEKNKPLGSLQLKFFGSDSRNSAIITMNTDKNGKLTRKKDKELIQELAELNIGNLEKDIEIAEVEAAGRIAP